MSIVPIIAAVAGSTAAIAAAKKRQEEEKLASYTTNDLDGWEFKIMRSALGRFNSQKAIAKICAEEARNGWELVEKFDETRLRFKRRVERRAADAQAAIDPYRTSVGSQSGMFISIIAGITLLLAGLVAFFLLGSRAGGLEIGFPSSPILWIAVATLALGLIVVALKRRH